MRKKSA
jgi:hypothetical protein